MLSPRQRVHTVGLALIIAAAMGHQATVWNWYIEDAAISFAYARNLADGHGLVATAWGERVEGYSNPTWVALLALCELVGWSSFSAAKVISLLLGGATVGLVYRLTAFAVARDDSDAPLLAAGFLAMNAQFAIWGGSGLENPLFNLLLVFALWRMFVELEDGALGEERFPWSAVAWFALAITRPEALAYAGVGGLFSLLWSVADGRSLKPTFRWLAVFWVPFVAYHLLRFQYFAWELPQTFYAKIGDHRPAQPLEWSSPGWNYFRRWANATGSGLLLPLWVAGMTGPRPARFLVALGLGFAWGFAAMLPVDHRLLLPVVLVFTYVLYVALIRQESGPRPRLVLLGLVPVGGFIAAAEVMRAQGARTQIPSPDWLADAPPWLAVAVALGVPLLAWGGRGTRARVVCWTLMVATLTYAVMVHGDWMMAFRWMSLLAVPSAVLLGVGAESIAQLAQDSVVDRPTRGWPAYAAAVLLLLAPLPANVIATREFVQRPETGPLAVRTRVEYKKDLLETMHWYGPIDDMDVDMGAHLYWSDFRMLDIAGLVDIPFAQHRFDRGFVLEYVFSERQPLFAHLHGGWAGNSRIPTMKEWRDQYIEIPGYPTGNQIHAGNHIRRDALFADTWTDEVDRSVTFERRIELVGWRIPSPLAAPGRRAYLEVALQTHRRMAAGFRVIAFLVDPSGEHLVSWDLPPIYDWVEVKDWRREEIAVSRFSPAIPAGLPEGRYELGFVLMGVDGELLPAMPDYDPEAAERTPLPPGAVLGGVGGVPARLAVGEVRFPDAIEIVAEPVVLEAADADVQEARDHAAADRCADAEASWARARAHRPRAFEWFETQKPALHAAIADCWVRKAEAEPDEAVAHVRYARDWDPSTEAVQTLGSRLADARYADGLAARDRQDWEAAYAAFSDVLAVAPQRAWARRYAEQARAERLEITAASKKERPDAWESRQVRSLEESAGDAPEDGDANEGGEGPK